MLINNHVYDFKFNMFFLIIFCLVVFVGFAFGVNDEQIVKTVFLIELITICSYAAIIQYIKFKIDNMVKNGVEDLIKLTHQKKENLISHRVIMMKLTDEHGQQYLFRKKLFTQDVVFFKFLVYKMSPLKITNKLYGYLCKNGFEMKLTQCEDDTKEEICAICDETFMLKVSMIF